MPNLTDTIIRKRQIKGPSRYPFHPWDWQQSKSLITLCKWSVGELRFVHIAGEPTSMEGCVLIPIKIQIHISFDPIIALLRI